MNNEDNLKFMSGSICVQPTVQGYRNEVTPFRSDHVNGN